MRSAATSNLVITNVTVFDGESGELREGPIAIEDGVVTSIGEVAPDRGLPVLDARGGVAIPGLIDAHFHAYAHTGDQFLLEATHPSYMVLAAARRLERALDRGFTTVRDVAGGDGGFARAIREGLLATPRYFFTGPALSQTGGHGDGRSADWDLCHAGGHVCELVDGVDQLLVATRERFRQGAHAIKVLASGGVGSPADPLRPAQYSADEIAAVCAEADRRGSYVAAHAYSPEAITHAVTNGVRSVEHGNLLDADSAALMAQRGAVLVPTLATYAAMSRRGADLGIAPVSLAKNLEVLEHGRASLEIARAAGIAIGFGTDLMGDLEDEQLDGLRLQSEVMGVLETLRSATSRNADLLGRPDLGRLASGSAGDLVVLDGDPFERPEVLWSPSSRRAVVQGGVVRPAPRAA